MIGDFKKSKVFFFLSEKQTQKDCADTNEKNTSKLNSTNANVFL